MEKLERWVEGDTQFESQNMCSHLVIICHTLKQIPPMTYGQLTSHYLRRLTPFPLVNIRDKEVEKGVSKKVHQSDQLNFSLTPQHYIFV